jgi:hypothetical protein
MNTSQHPVLSTVLYGFAGALSLIGFIPISGVIPLPIDVVSLTLWLTVAGYGVLLCRWSGQNLKTIFFPLCFLSLSIYLVPSMNSVFLLALAGVSWIRSGICFPQIRGLKIGIELLLCLVGAAMVKLLLPATIFSWALAIWLFFLLQATYFILIDINFPAPDKLNPLSNTFEQSSRQAVVILARSGIE